MPQPRPVDSDADLAGERPDTRPQLPIDPDFGTYDDGTYDDGTYHDGADDHGADDHGAHHEQAHVDGDVARHSGGARGRRGLATMLTVISIGGGLGSVARYLVSQAVPATADRFPWATFAINMSGCFALGLLMVFVLEVWPPNRYARPFLGVGFLGGYTTFSTFAMEIHGLAAGGAWPLADAYALNSLLGGLAAVWCGMALARLITRLPLRRGAEALTENS